MTAGINFVPFREGLARLRRSKSSYYTALRPECPNYDHDMPRTVPLGTAPNSPRAFVEHELNEYLEKFVARARLAEAARAQASCAHARKLVTARRTRHEASQGE
jgi:hypothetical protein